ncbi:MAG: diaminopimelate decarboxylase [Zestosphaera sp.]
MIRVDGPYLYVGCFKAEELAHRFGTPLYVYDVETLVGNYRRLIDSIPYRDVEILYSCKANNNLGILKTLKDLGCGLDAVSPWEALLGVRLGFPIRKILFTGNNVTDDDMMLVRGELGVLVNIDSIPQLKRYGRLFPGTEVSLRVNPGMGAGHHEYVVTGGITKFGVYPNQVEKAKELAKGYGLKIVGLHMHIGSGLLDPTPYLRALRTLLEIGKGFKELEFIDVGGGFGLPYRPREEPLNLTELGSGIANLLEEFTRKYGPVRLRMEPGRYIVGNAGVLLVRVIEVKETEVDGVRKVFIGVDSGMNHLIRPALYGAYHEVIPASKADHPKEVRADIVGNICESGDVLASDRSLPGLEEGDILAIMDVGAYGYSMSTNYNTRPRPAEVIVHGGEVRLTRRRETFDDLLRTSVLDDLILS